VLAASDTAAHEAFAVGGRALGLQGHPEMRPEHLTEVILPELRAKQRLAPDEEAAALRSLDAPGGSMGPKVEAICRFVEVTGGMAAIGRFEDVSQILAAAAGTIVTPDGRYDGLADLSSSAQRSLGVRRG
jgi:GMP synthase-like glutamine amidotransferase